jgi:hypothetical protein
MCHELSRSTRSSTWFDSARLIARVRFIGCRHESSSFWKGLNRELFDDRFSLELPDANGES